MGTLRWIGFTAGVLINLGTVIGVMKTLIVPRRGWSLLPAFVGRNGFRVFHGIAVRMRSYDMADRFLGFLAPTVIIGMFVAFLASFVLGFGLMLLPFADLSIGDAFRESGSSVFTLGFVSTDSPVPTALDVVAGATGMIFVALMIGYLPAIYTEVKKREALVKQLEGWTGVPSWGPEVLARFTMAGALDRLPALYASWDEWAASVADSHMKYPVLSHFRLPRANNHWVIGLLAVMDAAALDISLRPDGEHADARFLLNQGLHCLTSVTYPMRRVEPDDDHPGITQEEFRKGVDRLSSVGFPAVRNADEAWPSFAELRSRYAPLSYLLAYWTVAAPAPWSGERAGFVDLVGWPDAPEVWSIN